MRESETERETETETEDREMYQRFVRHDRRSFLVTLFIKDRGIKKAIIRDRVYQDIRDGSQRQILEHVRAR